MIESSFFFYSLDIEKVSGVMLISFLGAPSSGKTTIAAKIFAHLKEAGVDCEFVTEEARFYFAELKYLGKPISTGPYDQLEIMGRQYCRDRTFLSSNPGVVVTDSSPINALFYLPPAMPEEQILQFKSLAKLAADQTTIFFYTPPINAYTQEVNRVHSKEESLKIDQSIQGVIRAFVPEIANKIHRLDGDIESRTSQALHLIYEKM